MTIGKPSTSAHKNRNFLVVGATSSLAQAMCRELASYGYALTLVARDEEELATLAADVQARFQTDCKMIVCDLASQEFSAHSLIEQAGTFTDMVMAVGDMGNGDNHAAHNIAATMYLNYTAPAQIAASAAEALAQSGGGVIAIISSVAGDRGRQSNYAYGSAKAALSCFGSGLRNDYCKRGVHVMTVKPGFVDTPMTWGMKSPLIASRESVAQKIVSQLQRKKNVVYVPGFWRLIMLIICHIPEPIFKRLKL